MVNGYNPQDFSFFHRREKLVQLEKLRAELLRADRENAKLLQKYDVLKNRSKRNNLNA